MSIRTFVFFGTSKSIATALDSSLSGASGKFHDDSPDEKLTCLGRSFRYPSPMLSGSCKKRHYISRMGVVDIGVLTDVGLETNIK